MARPSPWCRISTLRYGVRGVASLHRDVALGFGVSLGLSLGLLFTGFAAADDKPACKMTAAGTGQVRAVVDGRTLQLADGREVRLAGIETSEGAKAALENAVSGREITLTRMGPETDRYGRVVALIAVNPGTPEQSVQHALLAQGQARVSANPGDSGCAAGLLRAEKAARAAGLGLWADPYYLMRNAEDPAGILAVRGRFAVVEGKVLSVREAGGTIYVNFGRRWTEDFTVTVAKRQERSFKAAGLELKKLAGQRVRVRGTIEERGGPWIEAASPAQIEIAERD
jgi:endonuclease YncB( thermonuclease family)